jgi:hypothetical protein
MDLIFQLVMMTDVVRKMERNVQMVNVAVSMDGVVSLRNTVVPAVNQNSESVMESLLL